MRQTSIFVGASSTRTAVGPRNNFALSSARACAQPNVREHRATSTIDKQRLRGGISVQSPRGGKSSREKSGATKRRSGGKRRGRPCSFFPFVASSLSRF